MFNLQESFADSLGKEPIEIFGFSNEDELNRELLPLMEENLDRESK